MTDTDFLASFSDAIEARVRAASASVATLSWGGHRQISAFFARPGVLVTSEQSLPRAERYEAVLSGGRRVAATLAGRDPSTNVAVLRVEGGAEAPETAVPAGVGGVVIALGGDGAGGVTARTGTLEVCGPAWESRAGGKIDALLRIGARLPHAAEGGPMIDARGKLLGMSTFGPRRSVLVIPAATIARVVDPLLAHGRIARGWLGAGLHPVALPRELAERAAADSGLMVVSLAEGGPARSVLLPGDILLHIGGVSVSAPRAVAAALGPETIGTELVLKILRGGMVATPDDHRRGEAGMTASLVLPRPAALVAPSAEPTTPSISATAGLLRVAVFASDPLRRRQLERALGRFDEATAEVLVVDLPPGSRMPAEAASFDGALVVLSDDPAVAADPAYAGVLARTSGEAQIRAASAAVAEGLHVRTPAPPEPAGFAPPEAPRPLLTPRELEILAQVGQGQGNKSIARRLGISAHTVKYHLEAIFAKLGVRSRAEAVTRGLRHGLLIV